MRSLEAAKAALCVAVAVLIAGCGGSTSGGLLSGQPSGDTNSGGSTSGGSTSGGSTSGGSTSGTPTLPTTVKFVSIPAGNFTMGTTSTRQAPPAVDSPQHMVTLSAFKMSDTEVTNGQYVEFLNAVLGKGLVTVGTQQFNGPAGSVSDTAVLGAGAAPYAGQIYIQLSEIGGVTSQGEPETDLNRSWIVYDDATRTFSVLDGGDGVNRSEWPATWIKWPGAAAFADYYSVALPSEAQWEYAARSGSNNTVYPTSTGGLNDTLANYNGDLPGVYNATGHVVSVRSYPANPWGLYEMAGNAWEWCRDYYDADYYGTTDGSTDPVNTTATDKRVRRGGSWNYHSATCTTYYRAGDLPDRGNNHFGFRIITD